MNLPAPSQAAGPPPGGTRQASVVSLNAISIDLQRMPVLRDLDLTVSARTVIGLLGANGSGKSTLLRVLATLVSPVAGVGHVLGAELGTEACVAVRCRIALVGHTPALYPQFTLRENLHFLARLTGRSELAADEALGVVGLGKAGDRRAATCSQGMQRRAELARVLFTEPSLLLLDEVHAGLDRASAGLVDLVVDAVRQRGGAAVLVSHEHDRLATVTDRLVEIVDGHAVPIGRTRS